jgi:hypothetical protein
LRSGSHTRAIEGTAGAVIEVNPIADAFLAYFGWTGLALFKGIIVLLVSGLSVWLSTYRPHAAGRILWFACTVLAGVVCYSFSLVSYLGMWRV